MPARRVERWVINLVRRRDLASAFGSDWRCLIVQKVSAAESEGEKWTVSFLQV